MLKVSNNLRKVKYEYPNNIAWLNDIVPLKDPSCYYGSVIGVNLSFFNDNYQFN